MKINLCSGLIRFLNRLKNKKTDWVTIKKRKKKETQIATPLLPILRMIPDELINQNYFWQAALQTVQKIQILIQPEKICVCFPNPNFDLSF